MQSNKNPVSGTSVRIGRQINGMKLKFRKRSNYIRIV